MAATDKQHRLISEKTIIVSTSVPEKGRSNALFRQKGNKSFLNLAGFTFFFGISALMTSTCIVYMISQLTTLEKYFGFSSYQSGVLLTCNEIGFLMTTLIVSHFARKIHIPRALALSAMLFGIAAIVCSLAHFRSISTSNYQKSLKTLEDFDNGELNSSFSNLSMIREQTKQVCNSNQTEIINSLDACADKESSNTGRIGTATGFTAIAFIIMAIGMVIQGMAKGPRVSLSSVFIDDNDEKEKTALYVGIISCLGIFGPALAFGIGGVFAKIYVTLEDVTITTIDPRWVGAWWAGFLLFGSLSILSGVPLLCFPRRFRPKANSKPKKQAIKLCGMLKDFMGDVYQVIRNPVYTLNVTCGCLDVFGITASLSFTPKYLETQFSLPVWKANLIMGMVTMFSAGIGTLLGGYLVSKFKCSPLTCLKCFMAAKVSFTLCVATDYYFGCSNPRIMDYNIETYTNVNNSCAPQCYCDVTDYFPLCGSDGRNYFSPCQAGCTGKNDLEYLDCACIGYNATARPGLCPSECDMVYGFGTMLMIASFVGALGIMPYFIFTIRSVHDKQKPIALGLQSFLHSTLGWLPAPVLFGMIVDSSCKLWSSSCKGQGACAMYDIEDFRIKRATFEMIVFLTLVCIQCLLLVLARKKTDWSRGASTDIMSKPEVEGMIENELDIVDVSSNSNDRI